MGAFANSPGEMRPGSFKVATETRAGSRHGRPRAGAAPAGWVLRGSAGHGAGLGPTGAGLQGQDPHPLPALVALGTPQTCGKGNDCSAGPVQSRELWDQQCCTGEKGTPQPSQPALAPQLWHQTGELPPQCHPSAATPLES